MTEDLDLSYRAQLAGWRFRYLDNLIVPSELPATLADFRSQQQRWAKGSIQTARKILPRLWKTQLPLTVKAEATAHLLANLGWLMGAIVTLTLYTTLVVRSGIGPYQLLRIDFPLFVATSGAIMLYFALFRREQPQKTPFSILCLLPVFGFFAQGIHAGYAVYFPQLFPTHLRATGAGFCFNTGRILAAPVLIWGSGWLKSHLDLRLAVTLLSGCFLLGLVFLAFLPEIEDNELQD